MVDVDGYYVTHDEDGVCPAMYTDIESLFFLNNTRIQPVDNLKGDVAWII